MARMRRARLRAMSSERRADLDGFAEALAGDGGLKEEALEVEAGFAEEGAIVGGELGFGGIDDFEGFSFEIGDETGGLIADEFGNASYQEGVGWLVVVEGEGIFLEDDPFFAAYLDADTGS